MKKFVFVAIAMAFFAFESNAQQSERETGIGIRGGVNFFNFGGADASSNDYTNRAGFHAGLYSSLFIGSSVALEPGVYYSVKGTQNNDFANSRAVLNYVDVPVLLRLYVGEGLNVFGGPQVSFLTSSQFEGDFFGSTFSFDTEAIRETDFGLVVGLGYNLPSGLNFQGSYDFGMSPVFKNSDAEIYNRGFKLSLGYTF